MTNARQTEPCASAVSVKGTELEAIVSRPLDRDWFGAIDGERMSIVVHSSKVGGRFSMLESLAAAGTASPMHYHQEDEIFHILEGVMTFSCGGEVFEVPAGTTVVIPAGAPHAWRNRTASPVRMTAVFVPGGIEDLFTRLDGLSAEAIVALAADYGTHVVGSPIP